MASYIAPSARSIRASASLACQGRAAAPADAVSSKVAPPAENGAANAAARRCADLGRLGDRRLTVARQILDQQEELVAPVASGGDSRPGERAQAIGHVGEHLVAERVAERVVHELDAVEVAEEHHHGRSLSLGVVEGRADALPHRGTVWQPGQMIAVGQAPQLPLGVRSRRGRVAHKTSSADAAL